MSTLGRRHGERVWALTAALTAFACTTTDSDVPPPNADAAESGVDASVEDRRPPDVSTEASDGSNDQAVGPDMTRGPIAGVAQKGPFILGSSINLQGLDDNLSPTGRIFAVMTTNDLGAFSISPNFSSRYVEIIASGYYFDEVSGTLSAAPLTLRAISDVSVAASINVNILTDLAGERIRVLKAAGTSFQAARAQAEAEVLAALDLPAIAFVFDQLDIARATQADSELLAASILLQEAAYQNGSSVVAELSQLLSYVRTSIAQSGAIGDETFANRVNCDARPRVDAASVRRNLVARYVSLGQTPNIGIFEPYLKMPPSCGADASAERDAVVDSSLDAADAPPNIGDATPADDAPHHFALVEYPIPSAHPHPYIIAVGPDGNLWFTENDYSQLGRITPTGSVTELPVPAGGFPEQMTVGPDGNLWLTNATADLVSRITPSGMFTDFPLPKGSTPNGITVGPDGKLWFGEINTAKIGWMTTDGMFGEFAIPMSSTATQPGSITTGPDDALWFVEGVANKIGRVTTAGVFTEFPVPTASSNPTRIIRGPDDNLWFIEESANKIVRMNTSGQMTEIPLQLTSPTWLTVGSDANVWVSSGNGLFARVTPLGAVTIVDLGVRLSFSIVGGPDGRLWFTDYYANAIGAFAPDGSAVDGGAGGAGGGGAGGAGGASGGSGGSGGGIGDGGTCSDASVGPPGAIECGQTTCYRPNYYCCTSFMGFCSPNAGCTQNSPPYTQLFCDGPEDCSPTQNCRYTYVVNSGCRSPPTDVLDAARTPVMCHADCDCPAVAPYCLYGIFSDLVTFGRTCRAPCTTAADCPIFDSNRQAFRPVQCAMQASGQGACVY